MFCRAIVTGGAGFIGSHLVDALDGLNKDVLIIDNLRSGNLDNIEQHKNSDNICFENADIRDERLSLLFADFRPDVVFHLAAIPGVGYSVEHPEESNSVNVDGTLLTSKSSGSSSHPPKTNNPNNRIFKY